MKYWIVLSHFLLLSCGVGSQKASSVQGHFEEQAPQELEKTKGSVSPLPEYRASEGIILSYHMVRRKPDKLPFVSHLLSKGKVWFLLPQGESGRRHPLLSELNRYLEANFGGEELASRQGHIYTFNSSEKKKEQAYSWAQGIWARDWAPISAKLDSKLAFFDFNYYASRRYEDSAVSGFTRQRRLSWEEAPGGQPAPFQRFSLPIYNEGGNFMVDDTGHCALARSPLLENLKVKSQGDIRLSMAEIKSYLKNTLGCQKVTLFPTLPYEKTGHIDLWGKFLGNNVVLVASLEKWQRGLVCPKPPEKMPVTSAAQKKCKTRLKHFDEIKSYLDNRAKDFFAMGYQVIKVATPLPEYRERKKGDTFIFRSFINALSYRDVQGEQHIYFPRFVRPPEKVKLWRGENAYSDAKYLKKYEERLLKSIKSINKQYGLSWKAYFVPSDDLIFQGGAVHCVTMQVPSIGTLLK